MFLVVISHYIYHGIKTRPELQGYYSLETLQGGVNFLTLNALYILSCVAVNCFVMISGYFLIERNTWRWKGIMKTWIETLFYSVVFMVASILVGGEVSVSEVVRSFLPVLGDKYWFMTYYIGLMLLAPLISRAAHGLNARQLYWVLIVLFVMNFQYLYGKVYGGFSTLMWFSFLFLTGGYVRKYKVPQWVIYHKGTLLLGIWGMLTLAALIININRGGQTTLMSTSYHGPVFFLSFLVFVFFAMSTLSGKWVDAICRIAPYTLAVYLIHANGFWNGLLWEWLIPNSFGAPIILYCLFSCFLIFMVCVIIDLLREKLFEFFGIKNFIERINGKLPQL